MPDSRPPPDPADPQLMNGESWDALCRALERSRRIVMGAGVPDSPQLRAEGFRYLTRFLQAGIRTCVEYADPDQPEFCRMIERHMTWGLDCPDCLYLYAPVRAGARYRIHGSLGSANHVDIQVNHGHFAFGDITKWGTLASLATPELRADADGRFELWLSAESRPGLCLPLETRASFLLVRQYFADWEGEVPAELMIEREAEGPAEPPRTDQMAARLERLAQWLDDGGALWEKMSRGLVEGSPNQLQVFVLPDDDASGGLAGQAYGMGGFQCEPDQVLLIEFRPPACRHWSLSLATWYWESVDYGTRQSSLNAHQARLDPDGVFRGVIAHRDPGVANWLDPAGHCQGTLVARFLLADAAPEVSIRSLAANQLDAALSADSPRVTPEARRDQLERRRRAVWARYRQ